ncbi:MAG: cysteine--tRNA ligase, partial [Rhodobiaceae bacterium]|nr:cysteine--tRNA ligase [Rhodobiaceae bacterium]
NGFLQVEGQKMSKSLGNFITINELLRTDKFGGRKWPGEVLRLAMLMTHYRQPIDFSVKRLEEAEAKAARWRNLFSEAGEGGDASEIGGVVEALADDLNTWDAIGALDKLASARNGAALKAGATLLGLEGVLAAQDAGDVGIDVDAFIKARLAARAEKNWAEADRIRDELAAKGIQLKDGKDPETGEPVTTWELVR